MKRFFFLEKKHVWDDRFLEKIDLQASKLWIT